MKSFYKDAIKKTLDSLDDMKSATASPFLYSKIRSRMQSVSVPVSARLAWQLIGVLAIAVVVNIAVLLKINAATPQPGSGKAASVATEYSITLLQSY